MDVQVPAETKAERLQSYSRVGACGDSPGQTIARWILCKRFLDFRI